MLTSAPGDARDRLMTAINNALLDARADHDPATLAAAILAAADSYAKSAPVKAKCPACVIPGPGPLFGEFTAMSDEQLFAMIANHVMASHNGGGTDAFSTAERVLPHIGQRWRERVAADPDSYRAAT